MPFTDSIKIVDVIVANKTALNATPADVAQGKQFIGTTQNIESGTLPVNTKRNDVTIVAGESFNIPYGINPVAYNVIAEGLGAETIGDATYEDILNGKTAWVNGEKVIGQMTNVGKEEAIINCGETHQITRGFHDGSGTVKAADLASQTQCYIDADSVLIDHDCWGNGEHIIGTMPNNKATEISLDAGESYVIPKGYHDGTGNVKAPELTFQTPGTATKSEIVDGFIAWVNGEKITGSMPTNPEEEVVLAPNGTYTIPMGYHTGRGTVTQNIPSMPAQTIGPTKETQTIACSGYVMEGDITISGVDALNYQRTNSNPSDSTGKEITNYDLSVSSNKASVILSVDNWHDNSTLNVYKATFTDLVDSNGNNVNFECLLMLDWKDQVTKTYKFGDVTISTELQSGTNAHVITIDGITSGKITLTEVFAAREFGSTNTDK